MADFATLVLGAETAGLLKGKKALEETTKAGAATEKAVGGTERGFVRAGRGAGAAAKQVDAFTAASNRTRGIALAAGKALGTMAVGFASFAAAGAAVRAISEFESSVSKMGAISGATTAELAAMRDVAKDLGSTTEFSAKQAADGLTFLSMAGFEAAESMAAIPAVLDLATSAGIGLAQAADTASNIMSGFGIAATEAASVSDVLAAASSRANTSVSQLGGAMSTVAPIASALDIGLADTAAAIGVLSDAGIQGERAGTAMRGVLASLAGPTTQAEAVINQLGLTIQDVDPATNSLSAVMGKLGAAGLSTADAMTLFGREAASGALVLIDGARRLGEFGQELRNVDGAAADMAGTMRNNLRGDLDGLQSAVSGLMLAMGDAGLTAIMRGVVSAATGVTQAFIAVFNSIASIGDAIASLGLFQSTTDRLALSADAANIAIADEIAQIGALTVATGSAVVVSEVAALNKLREAEAHLESAAAKQAEARATILNSDAYQGLVQSIETGRDALRSMNAESAIGAAAYEEAEQSLVAMLNRQQEMLALIPATSSEYAAAAAAVEDLRNRIEESKDGTVLLKGEVAGAADTTAALARLANGIDFGSAIAGAVQLANTLQISVVAAASLQNLQASINSGSGRGQDPRLFMDGGRLAGNASNAAASAVRIQEQMTAAFKATARAAKSAGSAAKSAGSAAATSAQSAIDKLHQQIDQERQLIGLSSDAKSQLEARHQVEAALAADKLTWNDAEINALRDKILLNKELLEEEKKRSKVLSTIFDGISTGDIKGIGNNILGMAQNSFSGILQGAFTTGGGGFAGVFDSLKSAATGIGSALSKGVGLFGKLGGAISSALPIIGAISTAISFFRTRTTDLDKGIRVLIDGLDSAVVQTYLLQEKVKWFGLSKKTVETVSTAKYDVANPIQAAVNSIGATVMGLADTIGLASENLDKVKFKFDVSTAGKTEEQIAKAVDAEMKRLGNAFADAAIGSFVEYLPDEAEIERLNRQVAATYNIGGEGGQGRGEAERALIDQQKVAAQTAIEVVHLNGALSDLQRDGEGSFDLLQRVVGELHGVNQAMLLFERETLDLSVAGASAASKLATLSGGLEAFSTNTQFVFANMLTDTAQEMRLTEIASEKLNGTLGALGIAIPETHAEFMEMLNGQDLMTEAGRNTHAALLDVAQAFVQVNGTAQAAADAIAAQSAAAAQAAQSARAADVAAGLGVAKARADAANAAMADADAMLRAAFAAERQRLSGSQSSSIDTTSVSARVGLFNTIRDALERAYADRRVLTALGQKMRLTDATAFLRSAVSSGGTSDVDRLEAALDAVADPSTALFKSFADYQHDYNVNTNLIERLKGLTDDSLSVEEKTLRSMESQSSILQSNNASQLAALDAQMNALLGIDSSVLSLGDAIAGFQSAKDAVSKAVDTVVPASTQFAAGSFGAKLDAIYMAELGRGVKQAGLDFYGGHYVNGLSLEDIQRDIMGSAEAAQYAATGIPSFDGGGYTGNGSRSGGVDGRGGFKAILHPQEVVTDLTKMRGQGGSNDNRDVVAALNETNARLRNLQKEVNSMARISRDQNVNGTPGTRTGAVVATQEVV